MKKGKLNSKHQIKIRKRITPGRLPDSLPNSVIGAMLGAAIFPALFDAVKSTGKETELVDSKLPGGTVIFKGYHRGVLKIEVRTVNKDGTGLWIDCPGYNGSIFLDREQMGDMYLIIEDYYMGIAKPWKESEVPNAL